ncbi:Crp/Fnr family transcriptional regulator [Pedobacter hiemivivus]|uniref:Crp/Fnr family transcriptional regulator n=1 Tax=Pedobacter hiemivivus TaxID=2530454 RepID=A0A4U1G741_9SPHI|nr:Crp/Fnr family transcriptional regulator [Pedobacter hiemivivus]TKC58450.1 Crp/Fnr family transcriptional regulator [Pedobacter hiemivivus]
MKEIKRATENKNYLLCKTSVRESIEDEFNSGDLRVSHRSEEELMIINDFLNYLRSFLDYSDAFYSSILPMLEVHTLDKMTVLAAEGEIGTDAFWLQSGYGRYFIRKVDGEGLPLEVTIDFCKPGKVMVIPVNSNFNLQLARGAVIILLPKDYFERLKLNAPVVEELRNKILDFEKQDFLEKMSMVNMKPREKYQEFLGFFGVEIEQYFAVKHIASYLGMQPSFLSRLRGENFKRKSE